MSELLTVILVSWLAGLAAFAGGIVAWLRGNEQTERQREITHGTIAFGGGILIAAVPFALLPQGLVVLDAASLGGALCAGGIAFCFLDRYLASQGNTKAQFMAMLTDFLPESLALGALFEHDYRLGVLLAAFIGAQNLPEGFNAFRELTIGGAAPRAALIALLSASVLGPLAASAGYFFLQDRDMLTAVIMAVASGGILYLIFHDIAPQANFGRHWTPALGAVLGFAVGVLGKKLIE